MQLNHVSLEFEDNGRFHNDLVLRLGDQQWRCDSYYLLIDRGMLADREDAAKVRDVLRRLLEQWHSSVVVSVKVKLATSLMTSQTNTRLGCGARQSESI